MVVGNTGTVTNGVIDGIGFAGTGDGGITNDYRIYPKSGTFVPANATNYPANSNANTAAYYQTVFGTHTAPTVQQALSTAEYGGDANNTQIGSTQAGAFGFAWHQVQLTKDGNVVSWGVDGFPMGTFDASALTLGANNIALGVSDVNTTTTRHPALLFTVIDNLTVTDTVPEPATMLSLTTFGAGAAMIRRRRR